MEMTALSLFFLNLLPIWHLDGMQLLTTLLSIGKIKVRSVVDPENQREGSARASPIPKIVALTVASLMLLNLVLQLYHFL